MWLEWNEQEGEIVNWVRVGWGTDFIGFYRAFLRTLLGILTCGMTWSTFSFRRITDTAEGTSSGSLETYKEVSNPEEQ